MDNNLSTESIMTYMQLVAIDLHRSRNRLAQKVQQVLGPCIRTVDFASWCTADNLLIIASLPRKAYPNAKPTTEPSAPPLALDTRL